jgi:hypothetical protein
MKSNISDLDEEKKTTFSNIGGIIPRAELKSKDG